MERTISVEFAEAEDGVEVAVDALQRSVVEFLDSYGEESLLGPCFAAVLYSGDGGEKPSGNRIQNRIDGRQKFDNLLKAAGTDEFEFFRHVVRQLESANHQNPPTVRVGEVELPKRFLMAVLEVLIPGEELISVRSVEQFEKLANVRIPAEDRENLQTVIDTYPVRLSKHVIRQARLSPDIAYQFMPFVEELDDAGLKNTWVGQFHRGLIEQMYQNRPIFVLHMSCPVYCRFCFRKHKDTRNQAAPTVEDVDEAIEYIRTSPRIKEIVLTGGEPLLNKKTLTRAVEGLRSIPHIQTIRIASRCISYYPHLFYKDNAFWLNYLRDTNRDLQKTGKRIEIATHFIHPDELSPQSLEIISALVTAGVQVYTQTPFLNKCNDEGPELAQLYRELRGAGSELHYIYIPASPIQGNSVYWTPLSKGHKVFSYLRGHLSDRAIPILCTATRIGKIDWNASGWAVEQSREHPRNVWIRTPYNAEYYREFVPDFEFDGVRENENGTIDAEFMAEIGDRQLFLGEFDGVPAFEREFDAEKLKRVQNELKEMRRLDEGVVLTGITSVFRSHLTRVDVDIAAATESEQEFQAAVEYIRSVPEVNDVVLSANVSILTLLDEISRFAAAVNMIPHVNALRLRSTTFTYEPHLFTDEVIERLADLQKLTAVNPTRIEIEAQFIHSSEFRLEHSAVISKFLSRGITVYNNIVLLAGINDNVEEMKKICYNCRQIGIELFQLYVAGLPIQRRYNAAQPVDATTVINIATHLRRHQSGREIPLYVVRTPLGEVDFNLSGIISASGAETVQMRLLPYSLEYYRRIDSGFELPEEMQIQHGEIVAPVSGLTVQSNTAYFIRPSRGPSV
ncbi:MAG: radical SAM protein [Spirochaetota bacterium]